MILTALGPLKLTVLAPCAGGQSGLVKALSSASVIVRWHCSNFKPNDMGDKNAWAGHKGIGSMIKWRWWCVAFVVVMAMGCATTAKYEQMLATWVGAAELDLYRSWGPPEALYEVSGGKFVSYLRSGQIRMPATAPTYQTIFTGNTAFTNAVGGSPAYNVQWSCKTIFEIRQEKVVAWRWQGDNCTSSGG